MPKIGIRSAGAFLLLCAALCGWNVGTASTDPSDLPIVQNGETHAVVLVEETADDRTVAAADKLVDYVYKATGAVLPILTEEQLNDQGGAPDGHVKIYVGPTTGLHPEAAGALVDLDEDGFVIQSHGRCLTIVGPTSWGTEFGVDEFLERYVGVRWLMPGPDGEDVPQTANLSVLQNVLIREEPAFVSRKLSPMSNPGHSIGPENIRWAGDNRIRDRIDYGHNLYNLFPPSVYGTTHPEFFPIRNGVPYIPSESAKASKWQPCFSNPDTVTEAIYNIVKYFNEHPGETYYSLGVNDEGGFCEQAPDHPANPHRKNSGGYDDMSDIYYAWVNQVVAGVLQVHPDKYFGLLAYREVMDPPSFSLNDRVIPYMTKDRYGWAAADVKSADMQRTQVWASKAANLGWYDYSYGSPYTLPRVYSHVMSDYMQFASQNSVIGLVSESYPNWGEGPKNWVYAKLMWNPNQDVDLLLDEWYERAVGPAAAPDLKAYYDFWEQFWTTEVPPTSWFQTYKNTSYFWFPSAAYLTLIGTAEIADMRELLESVVDKAQTPAQIKRAELLLRTFEYYEASALSYTPSSWPSPVMNATQALQMLDRIAQAGTYYEKRFQLIEEFKLSKAILNQSLTPQSFNLYWPYWHFAEYWELMDYLRSEAPNGPVHTQLNSYATAPARTTLRDWAKVMLKALNDDASNQTANPSFEANVGGSVVGWTLERKGTRGTVQFATNPSTAKDGSVSVSVYGADQGGAVSQPFAVKPGLLATRVYFHTPAGFPSTSEARIRMNLTLLDANGATLVSRDSAVVDASSAAGTWVPYDTIWDISTKWGAAFVDKAILKVYVDKLGDGETVYFDQVRAYQPEAPVVGGGDPTVVDDTDPTVHYSGTWTKYVNTLHIGGSQRLGMTQGAYADIPFNGTEATLFAPRNNVYGKAKIYVDGVYKATVDYYNPTVQYQKEIYATGPLTPGPHVLRIEAAWTKNGASTNYFVSFDALRVTP
ncbi:DUF4838 domain-containing protein [Paenibacillus flagellatus]|uniref:DUF4838 domain-containing protein n=1 Tax=Paenibacillus flagellatus TaxID=2211139 RepID=A0A2V5KBV9_9BACL|nr:DUF4838 domain-containing protein [Paenibacillus flagellatus]PYI55634.1 hypothetical protein DLM86_07860 [Paenibacillus flagellatus]